jgi:agmatine deiminase
MKKIIVTSLILLFCLNANCQKKVIKTANKIDILYTMPEESEPHEGTWLQWPHEYQYGEEYSDRLDATWIEMTKALITSEKVHLIVYNEEEKEKIEEMLEEAQVSLNDIDFNIYPTDDFWVRDNGPIFVRDKNGKLIIEDWGFNGWGKKAEFKKCNTIPSKIANDKNFQIVDLNNLMINEGGAVEIDGKGTLLATNFIYFCTHI